MNNWASTVPGDNSGGTTNTDTAVFNANLASPNNGVNLDVANWNIQNIIFDTANVSNYSIGSATSGFGLLLTGGGSITVTNPVAAANSETFNANITIEGSSYSFVNNAGASSAGLQFAGNVTGGTSGTINLTLDGTNEVSSTTGNNAIVGSISNGAATTLNLIKQGTGEWELRTTASNTYTGSTMINGGTLRVTTAGALPTTTDVTVNGPTSLLRLSATGTFPTIHSLTMTGGTTVAQISQSSNAGLNIFNNTGPGWIDDASTVTASLSNSAAIHFTGTVPGMDGFTLITSPTTPLQKLGSSTNGIDLGTVARTFNIPSGGQGISGQSQNSTDVQIDGLISGAGGGIIKTGNGVLKLQNAANSFTGPIEVQQGQLKLVGGSSPNSLSGVNPLLVDGGTLNINGANAQFGAATFTSGSTLSSTANLSAAITAPSFTFNVSNGSSFVMNNVLSDIGSPSPLVSTGAGTVTLAMPSTYTGGTTISAGTFIVANSSGSATGTGNVTLNGGILASASTGGGIISGNVLAGTGSHTIAPGGVGTVGTLSIGGLTSSNLTTLNFDLGSGTGTITTGDLLTLGAGTVSIGAGTALTFGGTTAVGNDYRLIGGSIGGISLSNFALPAAPAGQAYSLSTSVDPSFIDLVVAAGGVTTLTWNNASADSQWNFFSSNWNNGSGNSTYSNGSNVVFNDNNGGNYSVTLNTAVSPGSIAINNSAANYTLSGSGSLGGAASLTKSGSGVFTIGTANTSLGAVSITAGTLQLGASTGGATITSLAISGSGKFDVNNNHVIINYGSGPDPAASIGALLATGYNGGAWNGAGGITSTAAAANSGSYGVGWADSADAGNPAGLSSGTILIKYTLLGDADLNGIVSGIDFGIVAANFNKSVTSWDQGDFDYNHIVSGIDFGDLAANFNKGASGASEWAALVQFAEANGLMADVPEPATVGLLAVGACGLMARRRRS